MATAVAYQQILAAWQSMSGGILLPFSMRYLVKYPYAKLANVLQTWHIWTTVYFISFKNHFTVGYSSVSSVRFCVFSGLSLYRVVMVDDLNQKDHVFFVFSKHYIKLVFIIVYVRLSVSPSVYLSGYLLLLLLLCSCYCVFLVFCDAIILKIQFSTGSIWLTLQPANVRKVKAGRHHLSKC